MVLSDKIVNTGLNLKDLSFYKDKTVFITGHTGFKGSWMCHVLKLAGAKVFGYALSPQTDPNLFEIANIENGITSIIGDIRDFQTLDQAMQKASPQIVIHMAAQPIVLTSYENPIYTYETNVMGTVHICEAVRKCESVISFINVTTDKVYKNNEWEWGYRENDALDGFDPYSNSKSCSELVTSSYVHAFFDVLNLPVSTCRAGNVIGGGDFADKRIIPDCVRAMAEQKEIIVRNPYSTRPYQHVLESVCTYLLLAKKQTENKALASQYNIGPNDIDCVTTAKLVDMFCKIWGDRATWKNTAPKDAPHEANFLKLDCSKIKTKLNWQPRWNVQTAIQKTVEWSKVWLEDGDIIGIMDDQIQAFLGE